MRRVFAVRHPPRYHGLFVPVDRQVRQYTALPGGQHAVTLNPSAVTGCSRKISRAVGSREPVRLVQEEPPVLHNPLAQGKDGAIDAAAQAAGAIVEDFRYEPTVRLYGKTAPSTGENQVLHAGGILPLNAETDHLWFLPLQSFLRIPRILHFFDRLSLVAAAWTTDVSCFMELSPEPSPDIFRKALFEIRADATPADRLFQSALDFLERDLRITRRRVRTQGGRTGRARVGLVLGTAHVSRPGSHYLGRFLGTPRAYRTSLRSPVPHRPIPTTSPSLLTTARRRSGSPESTPRARARSCRRGCRRCDHGRRGS